jgi:hypothetical protein
VTLESDHSFVEMSHQMMETAWSWTNIPPEYSGINVAIMAGCSSSTVETGI